MTTLHSTLENVTARIARRSAESRAAFLALIDRGRATGTRTRLSCGNLAHGFAASGDDKPAIRGGASMNIGIVTAYNDMLSAHQPYARYPDQIRLFARERGCTAQVAGGVPAMCDGVTQGQPGMELSLFSRDTIALSTAVALSHNMFEGAALLGICDKIVPGLLIGALRFPHLPVICIPSGPMPSGLSNSEKARIRQQHAEGNATQDDLLDCESASYHSAGTCTFYGTANSNQMILEVMGLHLPGAAFVLPNTKLRQELTRAAIHRLTEIGWHGNDWRPIGHIVDERAIVNAAVALLATGGSTNLAIHLPAIARAAGIVFDWTDLSELSAIVPLVANVYPNGKEDVNAFHAAGGTGFVVKTLLENGLLHPDARTVSGQSLADYAALPHLDGEKLAWKHATSPSNDNVLRAAEAPFQADGGMRLVAGNLGRAIFKTSAVAPQRWTIEAPARIFSDQDDVLRAFRAGELDRDVVIVLRFQGPRACGMPELHKLSSALGVLQDRGYKVALVTDGRMSGASGKVPAAIHVTPEALAGGAIGKLRDGDIVRLSADEGTLEAKLTAQDWDLRDRAGAPIAEAGMGRELFAFFRGGADDAEKGGSAMLVAAGL